MTGTTVHSASPHLGAIKRNADSKPQKLVVKTFHYAPSQNNLNRHVTYITFFVAVPLQAWNGPEGSGKLRFPDFLTTAQDGGKVVSLTHRPPLPPGNIPGTHFC
jgi:hypothetical protein